MTNRVASSWTWPRRRSPLLWSILASKKRGSCDAPVNPRSKAIIINNTIIVKFNQNVEILVGSSSKKEAKEKSLDDAWCELFLQDGSACVAFFLFLSFWQKSKCSKKLYFTIGLRRYRRSFFSCDLWHCQVLKNEFEVFLEKKITNSSHLNYGLQGSVAGWNQPKNWSEVNRFSEKFCVLNVER